MGDKLTAAEVARHAKECPRERYVAACPLRAHIAAQGEEISRLWLEASAADVQKDREEERADKAEAEVKRLAKLVEAAEAVIAQPGVRERGG